MKLVNAEIKTAEELAQRILNGEKLFNKDGFKLSFGHLPNLELPWYVTEAINSSHTTHYIMTSEWTEPQTIQRPAEWYEIAIYPTPCKVWMDDADVKHAKLAYVIPAVIVKGNKTYFKTTSNDQWNNAVPITPKELFNGDK